MLRKISLKNISTCNKFSSYCGLEFKIKLTWDLRWVLNFIRRDKKIAKESSNTSQTLETPFLDRATQRYCFTADINISFDLSKIQWNEQKYKTSVIAGVTWRPGRHFERQKGWVGGTELWTSARGTSGREGPRAEASLRVYRETFNQQIRILSSPSKTMKYYRNIKKASFW